MHSLDVETLDYRQHKQLYHKLKAEEKQIMNLDFGGNSDILRTNYLDMYEGVHVEMVQTNRFDENSDLSTTDLGKTRMTREIHLKQRRNSNFWTLLDDTDCQIY